MEQSLDAVLSRRHLPETLDGIAEHRSVDLRLLIGLQAVNVDAEDLLGFGAVIDLITRLVLRVCGEHDEQPAVEWSLAQFGAEGDADLGGVGLGIVGGESGWAEDG